MTVPTLLRQLLTAATVDPRGEISRPVLGRLHSGRRTKDITVVKYFAPTSLPVGKE